jgi:hypothetical protein
MERRTRRGAQAGFLLCLGLMAAVATSARAELIQIKHDKCGRAYTSDTPDYRAFLASIWRDQIEREAGGGRPGGKWSWNDHWRLIIQGLVQDDATQGPQENASKYIAFIVEMRRTAGLPDLPPDVIARPRPFQDGRCADYPT